MSKNTSRIPEKPNLQEVDTSNILQNPRRPLELSQTQRSPSAPPSRTRTILTPRISPAEPRIKKLQQYQEFYAKKKKKLDLQRQQNQRQQNRNTLPLDESYQDHPDDALPEDEFHHTDILKTYYADDPNNPEYENPDYHHPTAAQIPSRTSPPYTDPTQHDDYHYPTESHEPPLSDSTNPLNVLTFFYQNNLSI
eukprot:GHVP01066603.1.p1 GENE.GHVP01066603.1~~GHVP01066603.1.p1  ORF type:complete len:194 (-),score=28.62 GHVP01066603.1:87-668(-)